MKQESIIVRNDDDLRNGYPSEGRSTQGSPPEHARSLVRVPGYPRTRIFALGTYPRTRIFLFRLVWTPLFL